MLGCPWRAFFDPFVQRVLEAFPYFDKGQLAMLHPNPSRRLVQGVGFYARTLNAIDCQQIQRDTERARRERDHGSGRGGIVMRG